MASMNGIQLKALKTFEGCEGTGFSANIYLDGKKVGHVHDAAYGGCYEYMYDTKEKSHEVEERIRQYFEKNPVVNTHEVYNTPLEEIDMKNLPREKYEEMLEAEDIFFSKLFELALREKEYKKNSKKGYPVLVYISFLSTQGHPTPLGICFSCCPTYDYNKDFEEQKEKSKLAYMTVYKSLNDFVI